MAAYGSNWEDIILKSFIGFHLLHMHQIPKTFFQVMTDTSC